MSSIWADLKYALRMMAKTPGHTAVLVLTLALGIGASTTIFSVVNSVLLQPLPYKDPDRLVRVYTEFPEMNLKKFWVSPPEYWQLSRLCQSCESVGALTRGTASLSGGDRPVKVPAGYATHTLLPLLGVQPLLGRTWTADEDVANTDPTVVVLSYGVWKRAYGADSGVIGRRITLDAIPVTIIGVMPEGFDYPGGIEAWVPSRLDPASQRWGNHGQEITARLKPGASIDAFRAELGALTARWTAERPKEHHIDAGDHPIITMPLQGEVVGSLSTTLWLLQGAVLFVLLIAIANVTNLLLARAESRSREIAVRHAVGATRPRLIRQLITESIVLGLVGGGLGVLVAVWALDATIALIPKSAPRVSEISLDGTALLFALVTTLVSSLLFGLAPILHTRKTDVHHALKEGSPRTGASKLRMRVRRALVVTEVALAVVLVIGCGLMVKSFMRLQQVDLGFEPDHLLTFDVELPERTYDTDAKVTAFWRRFQDRVRGLPGVEKMTLLGAMVPYRPIVANDMALPGKALPPGQGGFNVDYWQDTTEDTLETLGARLVKGRFLNASDVRGAPAVIVVNEAFERKFFPGEDALGKEVDITPWDTPNPEHGPPQEGLKPGPIQRIVGVVADIKNAGIDKPVGTEVFFSAWQSDELNAGPERTPRFVVRTSADPAAMAPAIARVLAELDPTLPMANVKTMDNILWEAVARPRFLTFLLGAFAAVALALAAIGIYGVMAYTVAQRTHEIGIRVALGARPGQVRGMVLRQAGVLAGLGVGLGLLAAIALQLVLDHALAGAMYGHTVREPLLFGGVVAAMVGAALIATWLPARRATRVAPTVALRSE